MDKVQSRIAVIGIIIEDRGMAGQVNELPPQVWSLYYRENGGSPMKKSR